MKNFLTNIWVHIVFIFVLGFFVFGRLHGFCASPAAMTIDYAMWNSYNIASEYLCGRVARNLQNPDYSDIVQISGINDPFSSSNQYGQILWNASGRTGTISQLDLWNTMVQATHDLDVSSMSSSELNQFLEECGVNQDLVGTNWAIKTCQLNGIRFYWATNKAGEWLGTSFANILAKFDTPSEELKSAIQAEASSSYPFSSNVLFNDSFHFLGTDTYNHVDLIQVFNFSSPVFIYSTDVNADFDYNLYVVSTDIDVHCSGYRFRQGGTTNQYFDGGAFSSGSDSFVINGVTYYYGILNPRFNSGGYGQFGINFQLSSLDFIKSYITENGFIGETIDSELVDSQSVPYTVPEIGELATPITDIYPILDAIRQGVISIPTTGELAKILYPSLADTIADAIADAKAKSIAIADTMDPTPPDPSDPDDSFQPVFDWIGDLFPDEMFTMFKPIFDIVGEPYSMYDTWLIIPAIFVFLFIFYVIISIF